MSTVKIAPVIGRASSLVGSISEMKEKFFSVAQAALYIGAALSFFDLVCDVAKVLEFRRTGRTQSANATIITIALSMFFQMLLVYVQNMKQIKRIIF
ncbi:hypothetical protein TrVE_jg2907 [Triparma verrucosa]|uniref:Uncharacterized protein n=1 Tax=Triparma verrucosa TaxID=1606542 RepID=A0A9W7FCK7_9STRA|nr:hypothetical protein TrVE_jg2907 [Triparma verrucosa]